MKRDIKNNKNHLTKSNINDEIKVEITRDENYLNQYFLLREKCYRNDLGLTNFSGMRDLYDSKGVIAIARVGQKVIGGSRLVMSLPNNYIRLPLEEEGFLMKELFPMLELDSYGYFEIGRSAVDAEYRNSQINYNINKLLVIKALESECYFQFTISTKTVFRINRMIGSKLNMEHELVDWIKVPLKEQYENLNDQGIFISVSFIRPQDTVIHRNKLLLYRENKSEEVLIV